MEKTLLCFRRVERPEWFQKGWPASSTENNQVDETTKHGLKTVQHFKPWKDHGEPFYEEMLSEKHG